MNQRLLKEYVDRVGIVTSGQLSEQTGIAKWMWHKPALELVREKDAFLCRLAHGEETFLSRHLLFCLSTVYIGPELSPEAQEVYDWLSDNLLLSQTEMMLQGGFSQREFELAFAELQQKLCVAPQAVKGERQGDAKQEGLLGEYEFLWVTAEQWLLGIHRPPRYKDLEYCLSEIRRLLRNHFSTRELDSLIFHGAL